jgi:tetratricopeptide (TPR) repeat protein
MSEVERAKTFFVQGLERYAVGDYPAAEQCFSQANALAPGRVSILANLSITLLKLNRIGAAKDLALQALALDAGNFEACMSLGACLEKEDKPAEALALFEKASALKPGAADPWSNRGHALSAMQRHEEALAHYDQAIQLQPDHAQAWTNRGNTLNELARYEASLASHDQALAIQPRLAEAWYNRGNVLTNLKRYKEGIGSYDQALRLQPGHADAHFNKGLSLLDHCDFAAGWREYEWRWQSTNFPSQKLLTDLPQWDGQRVPGRLLVWAEQGLGDEILYCSMLEELKTLAGQLTVTMDARLIPLFRRSLPGMQFLSRYEPLPPISADRQIAMGSAGQFLRRNLGDFPAGRGTLLKAGAFLKADSERTVQLRSRIASPGQRILGISWGSKRARLGAFKSLQLQDLLPVLSLPDTVFVDLQYGDTAAERRAFRETTGIDIRHIDDIDNFNDIDGLAALIEACDAVVTISNVTVHIAGALGKQSFLLAPWAKGKLWYWHEGQSQSLWYQSVRLYRQAQDGRWDAAIQALAADAGAVRLAD